MMQSVAGWVRRVERWLLHVWVVSAKGDVVMMNGEGQPSSFGWGLSPGSITEPVHPELHNFLHGGMGVAGRASAVDT